MTSAAVHQRAWSSTGEATSHHAVDMDAEPSVAPTVQRSTMPSSSRKRSTSPSSSEDTEVYSISGDESSDDSFETVRSRKAKRRIVATSSPASTLVSKTKEERWPHTILFMPDDPTVSLRAVNRQVLSVFLEGIAPNEIKDVRLNTRKNILAVDMMNASALDKFRRISDLAGIKVRSIIPMDGACVAGVVYDIDLAIVNSDLPILIKPADAGVVITGAFRLGNTRCVKLVFKGDSLPSHVKVGHFRHPVRPFMPKPLQCHNCMKLGHVKGVCTSSAVCPRCAEPHTADACRAETLKCGNCDGPHDAASKDCPRIKREIAVIKQMVRDSSTHKEAAERVRRRRNRRRKRSRQSANHMLPEHSTSPSSTEKAASTNRNVTQGSNKAEDWPALPRIQPAKEPAQPSRPAPTSKPISADDAPRVDRQIVPMLRSLVAVITELLRSLGTPTARSGLQVLDALSPILATLG